MNKVAEIISEEISQRGSITFAHFMELALYCPVYGYYEREQDTIGRRGDFYTSVSVGSLFGELLACQFVDWLEECSVQPVSQANWSRPQIVEAGAHEGRLARDILCWLQEKRPAFFARLEYWIVEPSARRRAWQKRTLSDFAGQVRLVSSLEELARRHQNGMTGIVFSNELLDSFPVHRMGWDAKQRAWFEWGVTIRDGEFSWIRIEPTTPVKSQRSIIPPLDHSISFDLHDQFVIEVCSAAEQWWHTAASVLQRGKLLTIDYGLTAEELLVPERTQGTLRAYQGHRVSSDLLASPGEQDLTAHVNFSTIQAAGESAGLKTEVFVTQEQFLTRIAAQVWKGASDLAEWSPQRTRQFQTLVHPEHLGGAFRVLVQGA